MKNILKTVLLALIMIGITLAAVPDAKFNADATVKAIPESSTTATVAVSFNAQATTGATTLAWDFGDGETGGNVNIISHAFAAGTWTVTLTATNADGSDTETKIITIHQAPVARPTGPAVAEKNTAVQFDASTSSDDSLTIKSYSWNFGDGATSALISPTHSYTRDGNFTVTLTVKDNYDVVSAPKYLSIRINKAPVAKVKMNTNVITAASVMVSTSSAYTFDASASEDDIPSTLLYYWDFGDGTSTSSVSSQKTFTQGTYIVALIVTDQDGKTSTKLLTVNAVTPPVADARVMSAAAYAGEVTSLNGASSTGDTLSYDWNFGDSSTGSGASVGHIYNTAGTYTATLTVTDKNRMTSNDTVSFTVLAKPVARAGNDKAVVVGTSITLDGTRSTGHGALSYSWNVGESIPRTGSRITFKYLTAGLKTVLLTVTDVNGRTSTDQMLINVLASGSAPTANAGADRTEGVDEDIYFQATGTDSDGDIVSFVWDFDDGTESTEQNVHHEFDEAGTYTVTLTTTDNDGLTAEDTVTITIKSSSDDLITDIELDEEKVKANEYVEISVETDGAETVRITVDGKAYTLDEDDDGMFWGRFRAPSGSDDYTINVVAEKDSEEEKKVISLTVDNDAPEIDSIDPENEVEDYKNTLTVEMDEEGECRYSEESEDFEDMKEMETSDDITFTDDFTINEGENKKFYILCKDTVGNEMDEPEVVEIERIADEDTQTNPGTGFFAENMTAIQIGIIFVLVVAAIGLVGYYFWQQQNQQ